MVNAVKVFTLRLCISAYYIHFKRVKVKIFTAFTIRGNIPLTKEDVSELEELLWKQLGSKEDYEKQCGNKPLGAFVRSIVGMDMNAAKEAFSEYLNDVNLDERQIYFVNQIVEYIVQNGMITDMSVLQSAPFTNMGSVVEVFSDLTLWMKIKNTIQKININANVA